jgi:hypothetical protein
MKRWQNPLILWCSKSNSQTTFCRELLINILQRQLRDDKRIVIDHAPEAAY